MKKIILLFLLYFIFPTVSFAQSGPNILIIGDSISLGRYPQIIKEAIPGTSLNIIAKVGYGSGAMLEEVRANILGLGNFTHIFILLGTNDAPGNGVDVQPIRNNLINLIYLVKPKSPKIYVSQIPPQKGENSVAQINKMISDLNVPEANIVDQSDLTLDMLAPDGVHLEEAGHQVVACNFMMASGLKTDCAKPKPTPKVSLPPKIPTRGKKCKILGIPTRDSLGFAPLRPDPGEPCEETVPTETVFACGSSITPLRQEEFDPYGEDPDCVVSGNTATCYRKIDFKVNLDLSKANLGILGNTQDQNLTDEQRVNEYLSWYLSGVPQVGDQVTLDPKKPEDIDRMVNFSGPIRKLLPYDLSNLAKAKIVEAQPENIHNYIVGNKDPLIGIFEGSNPFDPKIRLNDYDPFTRTFAAGLRGLVLTVVNNNLLQRLFENIPYSSLEDTVGEYVVSATDQKRNNLQDPSIKEGTVKLTITSTSKSP